MEKKTKKAALKSEDFPPRIIIKFQDALQLPYNNEDEIITFLSKKKILSVKELSKKYPGIQLKRLFTSVTPGEITKLVNKAKKLNPKYRPPNFFTYCRMDCPYGIDTNKLLQEIRKNKNVAFAYHAINPGPPPGVITRSDGCVGDQGYLDPAPKGINARYAWGFNGGLGKNSVKFIDIEYAWILTHEDLKDANVRFLWGKNNHPNHADHGTSVLGVILMQHNGVGGLGITPDVNPNVVSQISAGGTPALEDAIIFAAANLNYGDILLLEVQTRAAGEPPENCWPVEIDTPIFEQIELAVNNGIIVIEAAGNGEGLPGRKLDDFVGENGANVLDRNVRDSGAIVVGAASATNTHGKVRSSNYGNRVDCFAWGTKVFTADDPANHPSGGCPYKDNFSQTSSASAIIAGAAIAVQSIVVARGKQRLGAIEMRDILSNPSNSTGSRNAIGRMPDLKKIIDNVIPGLP